MNTAAGRQRRWLTIVALIIGMACLAVAWFVPIAGAGALAPEDQRWLSSWPGGGVALSEASPVEHGAVGVAHAYNYDARRTARAGVYVMPRTEGSFPNAISGEDGTQPPANVARHAATTPSLLTSTPRGAPGTAIEPLWAQAPNHGFLGGWSKTETIRPGKVIDRYGNDAGRFFWPGLALRSRLGHFLLARDPSNATRC